MQNDPGWTEIPHVSIYSLVSKGFKLGSQYYVNGTQLVSIYSLVSKGFKPGEDLLAWFVCIGFNIFPRFQGI